MGTPGVRLNGTLQFSTNATFSSGADLTLGSGSQVFLDDGTAANPSLTFRADVDTGFYRVGAADVRLSLDGVSRFAMSVNILQHIGSAASYIYLTHNTSGIFMGATNDASLIRAAANLIAMRNGANAQTLQLANTFTDGANYEALNIGGGVIGTNLAISVITAGTGADNLNLDLDAAGTGQVQTNAFRIGKTSGTNLSQVRVYSQSLDVASVAANVSAEQTFTVTGLATTDKVFVNKPSLSAGLGVVNARVSAADTLALTFMNTTAGAVDPGAETYTIVAIRS